MCERERAHNWTAEDLHLTIIEGSVANSFVENGTNVNGGEGERKMGGGRVTGNIQNLPITLVIRKV